jgi:hypothetical protein
MCSRHAAQVLTVLASLVMLVTGAQARLRAPGRYTGVVVFDRWGGCVLCSGYDFNYVSESAKAPLADQDRRRVELDATVVVQMVNPGKALLKEFAQVWTKPPEPPPAADPLRLSLQPAFADGEHASFQITALNTGTSEITLRYDALAAHVLMRRAAGSSVLEPSDSPSVAALTAHFMLEGAGDGPTRVRGGGVLAGVPHAWYVTSALSLPSGVILGPGERTSLTVAVDSRPASTTRSPPTATTVSPAAARRPTPSPSTSAPTAWLTGRPCPSDRIDGTNFKPVRERRLRPVKWPGAFSAHSRSCSSSA